MKSLILLCVSVCGAAALIDCDVVVAGGSTAALSAATNAARFAPELSVCLTEPTDWLGGQMTSSSVSAIDYGPCNTADQYHPPDWRDLVASLGLNNPGDCWVSVKCYLPNILIEGWIQDVLDSLPNLHVHYNTVIKRVKTNGRKISSVVGVTRTPREGIDQWDHAVSEMIDDWYSADDSDVFTKDIVEFAGSNNNGSNFVVIETTSYGDVLILSNATYAQGIEIPNEDSLNTLDTCGQAITYPFYMVYNYDMVEYDNSLVNLTDQDFSLNGQSWECVWAYRRSVGFTHGTHSQTKLGEVSNQNWGTNGGNDYLDGYVLLPRDISAEQASEWRGGINVTTLKEAERRAKEYYTWYKNTAPKNVIPHLSLGPRSIQGTNTGLSMLPYIRDTRRSVGLDGFRLQKADMSESTLEVFEDRIALGHYLYADTHPLRSCAAPPYLSDNAIVPYYIPFRALTNGDFDNLLVAGLTMAQTYFANAGTRLHPEEWMTGLAAGLGSAIMARNDHTSRDMYENIAVLQEEIRKLVPIDWGSDPECVSPDPLPTCPI